MPTVALVTDVGNDLGYGLPVAQIIAWVNQCLDQLDCAGATTVITQLPLESLQRMSAAKFSFYRTLFFPSCTLPLSELISLANTLNSELLATGERRKISVIPVSGAWYGFDPIHLKRSTWHEAWPKILAAWREDDGVSATPRPSFARWTYLRSLAPAERTFFGCPRRSAQPCGALRDGTTISLY